MRNFILNNGLAILIAITTFHFVMLAYFVTNYLKYKKKITLWMGLVGFGLLYDSFIITIGKHLGSSLKLLSQFRFIFHASLIPFLIAICAYSISKNQKVRKIGLAITFTLSAIGLVAGILLKTKPEEIVGIVRFVNDKSLTATWVSSFTNALSFGAVVPLIIVGAIIIFTQHNCSLFFSGLLMFIFAAIAPATGNMDLMLWTSMIGEVFMSLFFALYNKSQISKNI